MHQFTDSKNRTWTITATIGALRRVKDLTAAAGDKIDLLQLGKDDNAVGLRLLDPVDLVNVAWLLASRPVGNEETDGTDFELEFAHSLDATAMAGLVKAIHEELADFFQPMRPDVAATLRAQLLMIETFLTHGSSSTSSPESSESTPTGLPCAV
jgi:hypothetical protein